jgi:branched-chain amino acid transport system permease protein
LRPECSTLGQTYGLALYVALPAAVLLTVLAGVGLGAVSFVPALQRLSNANILMLTVGLLTLLEGFDLAVWGSQPYALRPFSGDNPVQIGSILVPTQGFGCLERR